MGQRILALELGVERVRAALAERSYNALELVGVYEQERALDEPDLTGALARIVAAAGPADVTISALPGELVANRLLALPFTDRRRLKQVVPFALEEHLPFAVDDAAVAFARVGHPGPGSLVIAAFTRKDQIRRHLATLATAGLDPKIVTLGTHALAGFLARARNGGGSHLVLEIDEASTSMVLLDESGTPRAMRTVGYGLDLHAGASTPQNPAVAALTAIRQTLLAHSANHATPDLVLTGSAATAQVHDELAAALAVPIHDLGDFDCSALIQGVTVEAARFAECLAMLLGEAPSSPLELLNFRQGEFAFRGPSGAAHPLRLSAALGLGALAVAILHVALALTVSGRQLGLLDRQIAAITAPALGDSDPANARTALQAKISDMSKRLQLLGVNLGQGSPLDVLLEISRAIPPAIAVQTNSLVVDDTGVKLDGAADSFATVDQIKRALERAGGFGAIQVEHAGAGADTSKVEFRLSADLKDTVAAP